LALALYIFIGLPALTRISETQGVLAAYPIYILAVIAFAYVFAVQIVRNRRLFVSFILLFIAADIIMPPQMIPWEGSPNLTSAQTLAGDYYFYSLYMQAGLSHQISWLLTYLATSAMLLLAAIYELKTRRLANLVPQIL
jgi:hypothetical protein